MGSQIMGKHPSITIALVTIVAVGIVISFARPTRYVETIHCYFEDAQGLKAGATVRLAGVDVGQVMSVRARPERHEAAAEVTMLIHTDYDLQIPSDAVVVLDSSGVFSPVFPEIEVKGAVGPPTVHEAVLRTRERHQTTAAELIDCFAKLSEHKPCPLLDANHGETAKPSH
jgi:ABC-type transporter Mla subunit MlaD